MLPVLTIVDDFLPWPRFWQIRQKVLDVGFQTEVVKEGKELPEAVYENVQMRWMPPDFVETIPYLFGRPITMANQAFRLGFKDSQLHNLVHADHCCSALAAVHYLNEPIDCQGGTAFWKHKGTGWDMMPTEEQMKEEGIGLEDFGNDWQNADAWEMVSLAGMKPNRLITYPTHAFHSRWPWQGFGSKDDPEHARLIFCAFFDLL